MCAWHCMYHSVLEACALTCSLPWWMIYVGVLPTNLKPRALRICVKGLISVNVQISLKQHPLYGTCSVPLYPTLCLPVFGTESAFGTERKTPAFSGLKQAKLSLKMTKLAGLAQFGGKDLPEGICRAFRFATNVPYL